MLLSGEKENILKVRISPSAKVSKVLGVIDGDTLKVAIAAAPEKNKANKELIKFLSLTFNVAKSSLLIIQGGTSRNKKIEIIDGDALPYVKKYLKEVI